MNLSAERIPDPRRYSAVKVRIAAANILLQVAAAALFSVAVSRQLYAGLTGYMGYYPSTAVFALLFFLYLQVVTLPMRFFGGFVTEHEFGLSMQDPVSWSRDEIKGSALTLTLNVACAEVFYLFLRIFPSIWPLVCALVWIAFSIALTKLLPAVVVPMFFKYSDISERDLKEKILSLADKAGIGPVDVCKIDMSAKTRKANAALIGIGGTRKVVLGDTLTDTFDMPEVMSVVAHEFGHYKLRHVWRFLCFSEVFTALSLILLYVFRGTVMSLSGINELSDAGGSLPVIFLLSTIFSFLIFRPLYNMYSRRLEREADTYALEITGNAPAFVSLMDKLAEMNFADRDPSPLKKMFFYDHPPVKVRIEAAREYEKRS